MSSAGTHICKREKAQVNTRKNAQKIHTEMCHLQGGPTCQSKRGNQANAPRDLDMGPQIRLPEEDKDERRPGGSAEPGRPPVQVHFDVACPLLLLITFHICFWREPTLKTIKGAPSTSLTHTISYVKEKSREAPPLCIISLGSV